MPHAALWVVQPLDGVDTPAQVDVVSMPHAALWVVQRARAPAAGSHRAVSMPHAALWVVQRASQASLRRLQVVSMPHAALWVVQHEKCIHVRGKHCRFNAARGFVGGATELKGVHYDDQIGFNAARGFVGGATASLAALVPLGGKSPFGKSPEIRAF